MFAKSVDIHVEQRAIEQCFLFSSKRQNISENVQLCILRFFLGCNSPRKIITGEQLIIKKDVLHLSKIIIIKLFTP